MKINLGLLTVIMLLQTTYTRVFAQTNTFPATGNVGVGTLTPLEKLSVVTAAAVPGITHTDGITKLGTYINAGAAYFGTFTNHPLAFRTNNGGAQLILLQNGNFGVGTTSPLERLTIQSASNVVGFAHTNGIIKLGNVMTGSGALFGTITNHPLYLRTNNNAAQITLLQSGRVGIGTTLPVGKLDVRGEDAYIQGVRAGVGNAADTTNTCFGRNSLLRDSADTNNYLGIFNTAIGLSTLTSNTQGYSNSAIGAYALTKNTAGYGNTAMGFAALGENTNGVYNVAIGLYSLSKNTFGGSNTAVGDAALSTNTSGGSNVAIGSVALNLNIQGNSNTAVGGGTLLRNTTGSQNTAIGYHALHDNNASDNTAVGNLSLDSNTTGSENTALGTHTLYHSTTASWNTAIGRYALYNNKSGIENTAVGDVALFNNTTGGYNTGLGYLATPNSGALTNTTALGYNARTTASNQVRIGNSAVTSIGGYANWSNISDGRVKKNIKENVPGLAFINQLKPVTYNLNLEEADKIINAVSVTDKSKNDAHALRESASARALKEQTIYSGFVAQDVEKAAKSLNYDFSGVDTPKNDKDLYALRYAEFVVPLVRSVQELSKLNDEKDSKMNDLQKQIYEKDTKINDLQKQVDKIIELISGDKNIPAPQIKQNVFIKGGSLNQNNPNPFDHSTMIGYTLPLENVSARIVISNKAGQTLKEVNISGRGKGSVSINTASMSTGSYQYSLFVNDILIETKQMILKR
jgi:hypothetical protein